MPKRPTNEAHLEKKAAAVRARERMEAAVDAVMDENLQARNNSMKYQTFLAAQMLIS